MDAEFGPWVKHDGRGCPVPDGVVVRMECFSPVAGRYVTKPLCIGRDYARASWDEVDACEPWPFGILRYQIRKPRALLDLIEMVEALPVREPAHV